MSIFTLSARFSVHVYRTSTSRFLGTRYDDDERNPYHEDDVDEAEEIEHHAADDGEHVSVPS